MHLQMFLQLDHTDLEGPLQASHQLIITHSLKTPLKSMSSFLLALIVSAQLEVEYTWLVHQQVVMDLVNQVNPVTTEVSLVIVTQHILAVKNICVVVVADIHQVAPVEAHHIYCHLVTIVTWQVIVFIVCLL